MNEASLRPALHWSRTSHVQQGKREFRVQMRRIVGNGEAAGLFCDDALAIVARYSDPTLTRKQVLPMKARREKLDGFSSQLRRIVQTMEILERDGVAFNAIANEWRSLPAYISGSDGFSFPIIKLRALSEISRRLSDQMRGSPGSKLETRRNYLVADLADAYESRTGKIIPTRRPTEFSSVVAIALNHGRFRVGEVRDAVRAGLKLREKLRRLGQGTVWRIDIVLSAEPPDSGS